MSVGSWSRRATAHRATAPKSVTDEAAAAAVVMVVVVVVMAAAAAAAVAVAVLHTRPQPIALHVR